MNTIKTMLLMTLLGALMVVCGGALGGRDGATVMLLIALVMNFVSYWFSDSMVLKAYHAQPIERSQAPELYDLVAKLAQRAELPMPKVCVINSNVPNAFATGRNASHAAVAVTTGIMRALSYDELGGVLAHELSHIKHHDTLISTVAATMATFISYIANMAQWAMIFGGRSSNRDDNGGGLGALFAIIVAPFAAMLIQMAISRSREYEADKSGGEICGNPLYLARALEKIDDYASSSRTLQGATPATAHMFIINPLKGSKVSFASLFSTHPSTEERVERLRQQAQEMRLPGNR